MRNQPHEPFRLLAAAAVDGRISAEEAAELETHLLGCEPCRADQQAMLRHHRWLANPATVEAPNPRVEAAVLAAARAGRRSGSGAWSVLVAASLVVMLGAAGVAVWSGRQAGAGGNPAPSTMSLGPSEVPAACAPIPLGLVGWWPGEGGGRELLLGRDVGLHGAVDFTRGRVGDAFDLPGLGGFLEVADSEAFDVGVTDFTVLLWVRFAETDGEQVLAEQWIDRLGSGPPAQGWTFTKLATNVLRFAVSTDRGVTIEADSPPLPLTAGAWLHLAARRDGRVYSILIDGVEIARVVDDGLVANLGAPASLKFGRRGDERGYFLHGQLDEIQFILGRAMSDADVQAIYDAGAAGVCRP